MNTTSQISQLLQGELIGNPDIVITGPSRIEEGGAGTITFLANPKYEAFIYHTQASAVVVSKEFKPEKEISATLIKVDDVYQSLSTLLQLYEQQEQLPIGIATTAFVSNKATVGKNVSIDHFTVIYDGVEIGDDAIIFAQVYLGKGVKIGSGTKIYPGVKIYHDCVIGNNVIIHANTVIGSDGFGFSKSEDGSYLKIPQNGNVIVEDDVEIGSNTVIDRASIGSTIIRKGVKLDNLIQIAHNAEIGEDTVIAAQAGIAGSAKIGRHCIIGGQVGLAGHIEIANGTMIQAKSGLSSSVKAENTRLYGYPALDYGHYLKSYAYFKKLPELAEKIKKLEKELDKILNGNG
ncbi:MAG: UDP-3-O-(3-hydroxymyristoyl)glucosamine N-acyltransferase [Saprospiraceae bacterium]|nr:UDP-3-O-(3-hydroxymyristoyl)glucosamine N-acyltransferase [Saprospiraceae bacterium]